MYAVDGTSTLAYKGGDHLPTWLILVMFGFAMASMIYYALRRKD